MATINLPKPVEQLPSTETKLGSIETVESAKPAAETQLVALKDMSISGQSFTSQIGEGSRQEQIQDHEAELPLVTTRSNTTASAANQLGAFSQALPMKAQNVEDHDKLQLSLQQLPKPGAVMKQQPPSRDEPAKKSKSKDDKSDSESSSSEDEDKKAKTEKKHTFGLSQAISSGFAGAAAGAASSLTGAATSAVLGAMRGKIGGAKPASAAPAQAKDEKKTEKNEKNESAQPSTEADQSQQKAAKDDSPKHHHNHHHHSHHRHHSSHGDKERHGWEDKEGYHHEHSHSHDGHSHSHHHHSHGTHDDSKESVTKPSHESGHSHHHHHSSSKHNR